MKDISTFDFEGTGVRTLFLEGEPWWVAKDICTVLGIEKPENAYARLDDDESATCSMGDIGITDTLGRNQEMVIINEPGLYTLILTSRKKAAKRFKKWVTHEILPAIRKTGKYTILDAELPESTILNGDTQIKVSLDQFLQMAYDLTAAQKDVISLEKEKKSRLETMKYKNLIRAMTEHTTMTDEQIAGAMEEPLGLYMPEWVAWQRRVKKNTDPHN